MKIDESKKLFSLAGAKRDEISAVEVWNREKCETGGAFGKGFVAGQGRSVDVPYVIARQFFREAKQ